MTINFDMDGTIANLYKGEWLKELERHSTKPYETAEPLLNLNTLARLLNELQAKGNEINIISWLAKNSTTEYDEAVTKAKKKWLSVHLNSVKFNHIYIVPYGTSKKSLSNGILFDDEEHNRIEWGVGAYDVNNIIEVLKALR